MTAYHDKIRKKASLIGSVIAHPRFDAAISALTEFRDVHLERVRQGDQASMQDGQALLLTGPTGSGKSTVLAEFERRHRLEFGDDARILRFAFMADCTPKQLAFRFASAMGDPLAARSTFGQLQERILAAAAEMKLCMVVMDEGQHLYSKTKNVQNEDAADAIKFLMDELRIPFVMAGMPELRRMVEANLQLNRRVARKVELAAFDLADADDHDAYIAVLREIDKGLPFGRSSQLSDRSIAAAIHGSTDGVIGLVKRLVVRATQIAVEKDDLCVDIRHLAQAHDELVTEDRQKKTNPFAPLFQKRAA